MATKKLGLPYIQQAQSQKEATHADDLDLIDRNLGSFRWSLLKAMTPAGTGPDQYEMVVPTIDGEQTTFLIVGAEFVQAVTGSTASQAQLQTSPGGDSAFGSGTNVLSSPVQIPAGGYFATSTAVVGAAVATVVSGQRIRVVVAQVGTGSQFWSLNVYATRAPWSFGPGDGGQVQGQLGTRFSVSDEGTVLVAAGSVTGLNFVGAAVTATASGGMVTVTINGAGGGGGSTAPGGSNGQLQYNANGAFGGVSGLSWNGTTLTLPQSVFSGSASLTGNLTGAGALSISGNGVFGGTVKAASGYLAADGTAGATNSNVSGLSFKNGLFVSGTVTIPPIAAQSQGTVVTSKITAINFVGAGVSTTADASGTVTVTIPQTTATIAGQDEGTTVETSFTAINFIGAGVTATANGTVLTVVIPGGGGTGTAVDYGVDPSAVTQVQNSGPQTIPSSTPTTIVLGTVVSDAGGHWTPASNTYKVPGDGLYIVVGYVRLDDSTPAGTNIAVGIGSAANGIEYRWDSVGSGPAHRKNLNLSIARVASENDELMLSVFVDGVNASSIEARLTFVRLTGSKQTAGGGGGGGTGTVTSFAFTNGQGVTGTVSDPTTAPKLSLSFGAFTPTSLQPTGNYYAVDGTAGGSGTVNGGIVFKNGLFVSGSIDLSGYLPKSGGTMTGALIATGQTIRGNFVSNAGNAGATLSPTGEGYVFESGLVRSFTNPGWGGTITVADLVITVTATGRISGVTKGGTAQATGSSVTASTQTGGTTQAGG